MDMPGRMLPRYCHSKLPSTSHTRLIELFPASDPSYDLRCRIRVVKQARAKATYHAISYTWGCPDFTCNLVIVDDILDNQGSTQCQYTPGRVPITRSLDGALRRFRDYSSAAQTRCLWADAVCIDQDNPKEKAHHIPLMTSIYRDAIGVLVWLGGNAGRQISLYDSNFLDHPWFRRRWVIQEVVLNKTIIVVSENATRSFYELCEVAYDIYRNRSGRVPTILAIRAASAWQIHLMRSALHDKYSAEGQTVDYNICKLMRSFDQYDCADPRDKVFTLASLARDVDTREVDLATFRQAFDGTAHVGALVHRFRRPQIMVIYEEGTTVENIYTMFGRSIGEAGNLPWVLGEASARLDSPCAVLQIKQDVVPSWIPDWRIHSQRPSFWTYGYDVRYFLRSHPVMTLGTWTGNDTDQPTFNITLSHKQSQNTTQRVFRIQLPLTRITQDSDRARKDDYRSIAPLKVTWRSETFPSSVESWLEAATCTKKTFNRLWKIVEVHAKHVASSSAIKYSPVSLRNDFAERFAYILIAGGMFMEGGEIDRSSAIRLCEFADTFYDSGTFWEILSHAVAWRKRRPSRFKDIDLLYHGSNSFHELHAEQQTSDLVAPNVAFLIKMFILSDIDFSTHENWKQLVRTIAWTMQGRCVFACDVENKPPDASPMDILGIGSDFLDLNDRIMAIPFHVTESELKRKRPLSLLNLWSRTYLVRPISGGVDEELGNDACAPTFQLVGDCFLSTVRWLSPQRGLMPPEWFTIDNDNVGEAVLKETYRSHFSEVVKDSVIYFS